MTFADDSPAIANDSDVLFKQVGLIADVLRRDN
jgi:hypothetical protein